MQDKELETYLLYHINIHHGDRLQCEKAQGRADQGQERNQESPSADVCWSPTCSSAQRGIVGSGADPMHTLLRAQLK